MNLRNKKKWKLKFKNKMVVRVVKTQNKMWKEEEKIRILKIHSRILFKSNSIDLKESKLRKMQEIKITILKNTRIQFN